MPKVALYNQNGSTAGDIELNASVFGIEPNESVVFDAILMQRASLRQGTHKVKNRSEVRGGGRKPWRQKGTGRARQGSIRSPQWRGGGVVFGPTPRSYSYKLPKKVRRLAIKSVLSSKVNDNNIIVLEDLTLDTAKTKEMAAILKGLSVEKKALIVTADANEAVALSARNIPGVTVVEANGINVLDVVNHEKLLSAGITIYLAAEKENRFSLPNTRYMIHQPAGGVQGQSTEIEIEAKEIIRMRERINRLIAEATGQSYEKISKDTDRNFWLSVNEAKDYGIVNEIIENRDGLK